jgi:hypothetical protein
MLLLGLLVELGLTISIGFLKNWTWALCILIRGSSPT